MSMSSVLCTSTVHYTVANVIAIVLMYIIRSALGGVQNSIYTQYKSRCDVSTSQTLSSISDNVNC